MAHKDSRLFVAHCRYDHMTGDTKIQSKCQTSDQDDLIFAKQMVIVSNWQMFYVYIIYLGK